VTDITQTKFRKYVNLVLNSNWWIYGLHIFLIKNVYTYVFTKKEYISGVRAGGANAPPNVLICRKFGRRPVDTLVFY